MITTCSSMPKNSTIYLLVHPKPQTKVMSMYINPSMDIIPQSTDVPDLGIIMSKDCSFDSHISSLSRKCLPLNSSNLINTALLMSFSPLFYVNSVFCMCVVCLLSFVDFNKIFYPKKNLARWILRSFAPAIN